MEKINTENIILSLLFFGFDQIDPFLYTLVLEKLTNDGVTSEYNYADESLTSDFSMVVDCNGVVYRLKKGLTFDVNLRSKGYSTEQLMMTDLKNGEPIEYFKRFNYCSDIDKFLFKKILSIENAKLFECLMKLDFKEIILQKVMMIGLPNINEYLYLFSNKEIMLIGELSDLHAFDNLDIGGFKKKELVKL